MPGEFWAGARLSIRITPADVGKRVSVRQLTSSADEKSTYRDTIGVLTSWDAGVVSITRGNGELVRIAESVLVAGKVVPPAPARRGLRVPPATPEDLAAAASRAWPATETTRLGDWELRASGGFTRRANSVLVAGDPRMPLPQALMAVRQWYAERGLPPLLQVHDGSPYAQELDAAGWAPEAETLVRTAPLAPLTSLPDRGATGPVELSRTASAQWLAAYHRTGELSEAARGVVAGGPSVWFATAPGAIGRAVVDGRWALFGAVEVAPEHRRKGLALAVMGALAQRAYAEGATAAYLQVEADNAAARALYDRLGFVDHHRYYYRRPSR